jgi:hypothetical protein
LARYLSEFDFRYSNRIALGINDEARAEKALQGVAGKRLTYRRSHSANIHWATSKTLSTLDKIAD